MEQVYLVCRHREIPDIDQYNVYVEKVNGYKGLQKALEMGREEVINVVKASGLRGRGGAGFPTGVKWGFMPKKVEGPVYFVINCAEGEPGTFGNHEIIERNPHQIIEGVIIGAYAIGATQPLEALTVVRLKRNRTKFNVTAGMQGTIVMVYDYPPLPLGYEVEFLDSLSTRATCIRPVRKDVAWNSSAMIFGTWRSAARGWTQRSCRGPTFRVPI